MEAVPYQAMSLVDSSSNSTHSNGTMRAHVRNQCSAALAEPTAFVGRDVSLFLSLFDLNRGC